jgi:glycosyltransferase 2 family protein
MFKRILRWLILGGTLFFLAKTLKDNWLQVIDIRIDGVGWTVIAIATLTTLVAHTWAGWVWTWVLKELNQSVPTFYFIQVYLKTNLAKYLPGNVWHYYGRIIAAKNAGVTMGAATLSVLLEPVLMATAALIIIILLGSELTVYSRNVSIRILQILGLIGVLCILHPRFLNPILNFVKKLKAKKSDANDVASLNLRQYPLIPLLGELAFLGLRGTGFILTLLALAPFQVSQIPLLLGAFTVAWLVGLIVPGAPGGLGVFEATAIALLQNHFPAALVISVICLYRLISIIAETVGAGLAWIGSRE